MKLLYLTTWDFHNETADGVCKKIRAQIKVFERAGLYVDLIRVKDDEILYKKDGHEKVIEHVGAIKKTPAYIKLYKHIKDERYDFVYNRFGMFDTFYYRVLKRLKKNGARIIMELPTYPYAGERNPGFLNWVMFKWDDLYINKASKLIDRIVTFFDTDIDIWGVPTFRIQNGIDVDSMKKVSVNKEKDDTINCIAVAMFQNYHGYDRMITGLSDYYKAGGQRKIRLHLVGGGPEYDSYCKLVADGNVADYVTMYGPKSGDELDAIYDKCDLAISSLGMYRIGLMDKASSLKTREYMAKGLPIVAGNEMDITSGDDFPYFLLTSNDDSPVDINSLVDFYDEVYSGNTKEYIVNYMREYAEKTCDWKNTLLPVINYIFEDKNN